MEYNALHCEDVCGRIISEVLRTRKQEYRYLRPLQNYGLGQFHITLYNLYQVAYLNKVYVLTRIDTNKGFNPEYAKAFRNKEDAINQMVVEFLRQGKNRNMRKKTHIVTGIAMPTSAFTFIGIFLRQR